MRDLFEKHILTIVASLGLTASIVAISIAIFGCKNGNSISWIIWVLIPLVLVGFVWFLVLRKFIEQSVGRLFDFLIPFLVIGFAFWYFFAEKLFEYNPNITNDVHILINPGGIFAMLMGLVTVIGIFLAYREVINLNYTYITSYDQLIIKLIEFVKKTKNEIKVVSFFPLFGYWQVNEKKREELKKAMIEKKDKIKFTCVNEDEHLKMLIRIAGKGTYKYDKVNTDNFEITEQRILKFQKESYEFLSQFVCKRKLPYNKMPGYYIFVNKEKAFIVTPIRLPNLSEMEITEEDMNNNEKLAKFVNSHLNKMLSTNKNGSGEREAMVETLGFETRDKSIIAMLDELADMYYEMP